MPKYLIMSEENITGLTLAHHGIKGQKWGIRRFQNEDGSLTPEGKERYLKNNQAKWSKQFDDEETTFKIGNKDYRMTIENSNNDENTQRIKNVMAEIWNEGMICLKMHGKKL